MKSFGLGRNTLGICAAAAMLTGCGGSQSPIGAPGTVSRVNSAASIAESFPYSRTFQYTHTRRAFIVPAHVTQIAVVARGAGAASASGGGRRGGRGGRVYAILLVTPGEKLVVVVGGEGSGMDGGFNGGANGGLSYYCESCFGYGGGGASDVRLAGGKLRDRILVAGGGGAPGGTYHTHFGKGGKGGGSVGGAGENGGYGVCGGKGGGGGSQSQGGIGGPGGFCYVGGGNPGSNGTFGAGGVGGQGSPSGASKAGGGGGGGGYYGGGGGGAGTFYSDVGGGGGGGGGGSSYADPSALRFESWPGWKSATTNGLIVISW